MDMFHGHVPIVVIIDLNLQDYLWVVDVYISDIKNSNPWSAMVIDFPLLLVLPTRGVEKSMNK